MLVIVNGQSRGATGRLAWQRVRESLAVGSFEEISPTSAEEAQRAARDAIARGEDTIIAAGGDGTVNTMLNAVMDPATDRPRNDVAFGAIGLGSSNDFHKPFAPERNKGGAYVRLSRPDARRVDVGKARLRHPDGSESIRYFLLNASMGVVAEGNAFFNEGDAIVRFLKTKNTESAILYAALTNIARYRAFSVDIEIDGKPALRAPVTNVGILKSVHFAGGMHYDTKVSRTDGAFDVNVWEAMTRLQTLGLIAALYRGQFDGRPRTRSLRGKAVTLTPERPAHLELDGEIFSVTQTELSVVPLALNLCG